MQEIFLDRVCLLYKAEQPLQVVLTSCRIRLE